MLPYKGLTCSRAKLGHTQHTDTPVLGSKHASLGFLHGAFLTSSAPSGLSMEGIFETGELDVDFFRYQNLTNPIHIDQTGGRGHGREGGRERHNEKNGILVFLTSARLITVFARTVSVSASARGGERKGERDRVCASERESERGEKRLSSILNKLN